MAFPDLRMLKTIENLSISPTRRPDLGGLISSYSPILVGRFIFVVHLFTKATALAGARSMEGLHSSSWLLQAQGFVSSSCIAIKAQVTHNSPALCLLFSFWLLGHFPPKLCWGCYFYFTILSVKHQSFLYSIIFTSWKGWTKRNF